MFLEDTVLEDDEEVIVAGGVWVEGAHVEVGAGEAQVGEGAALVEEGVVGIGKLFTVYIYISVVLVEFDK